MEISFKKSSLAFWILGIIWTGSFSVSRAKEPPPPLMPSQIEAYLLHLDRTVASAASKEEKSVLIDKLMQDEIQKRATLYDGTTTKAYSERGNASMGTKVNFVEERRHFNINIDPPSPGMVPIKDSAKIEINYGASPKRRIIKRDEGNKSKILSNQSIAMSLTVVEPNLNEKNVNIQYQGVADYLHTAESALRCAKLELTPVLEYAEALKQQNIQPSHQLVQFSTEMENLKNRQTKFEKEMESFATQGTAHSKITLAGMLALAIAILGCFKGLIDLILMIPKVIRMVKRSKPSQETEPET